MADKGPPALKLTVACKSHMKAMLPAPPPPALPAQQQEDAVQHVQQDPVQQDPIQPPAPPAQVPNPIQPHAPPVQVPNPIQPHGHLAHIPNPVLSPGPPAQVLTPVQPQLNWSYFKPEFSGKLEEDVGSPSFKIK